MVLAILGLLFACGCAKDRTEELSRMALTEADLPGNYTLEYEHTETDFGEDNLAGVEIEYKVGFDRADGEVHVLEGIAICLHPELVPSVDTWNINWQNMHGEYRVTELGEPNIGEYSSATKWEHKYKEESFLLLSFSKDDKWVKLKARGADYEFLKDLGIKAEKKIE